MSNPLHADYYADHAIRVVAEIEENECIARDTYRLRFRSAEMASRFLPGQFLMMRIADQQDPLIGRALALYDLVPGDNGQVDGVDVVYIAKGKFTSQLQHLQTGRVEVWGPLGNGFQLPPVERLVMVAGGIGQTPFLSVAKEALGLQSYGTPPRQGQHIEEVVFCYGARNESYFAGVDDFRAAGVDVRLSTDDGSLGHHGLVTDLLREALQDSDKSTQVVCCGPEPMMEAVAGVAGEFETPCQVSLETPMACGVGICFTCVAKVRQPDGEWDYKRTCVEGPVFDAAKIEW